MRLFSLILSLWLIGPALTACGSQDASTDAEVRIADDPIAEAVEAVAQGPTRGGDGSPIELQPLTGDQVAGANLAGELACSFRDESGDTLLLARADVRDDGPVWGMVNNNGHVEIIGNGQAGGFSDLSDGMSLNGKGLVVVLARGAAEPTGNESTEHEARLTVQRPDGAERDYDGTLTCGP